jgi:nitrogen fixation protein NifU and related proteins
VVLVTPSANDLEALYRRVILDHGRTPRHARLPAGVEFKAERDNPLCGDQVAVGIVLTGDSIASVGFEAQGCLISIAAASMMCERVSGNSLANAGDLCARYLQLVSARSERWPEDLGELAAFAAVARFPARASCASLAWQALRDALAAHAGSLCRSTGPR